MLFPVLKRAGLLALKMVLCCLLSGLTLCCQCGTARVPLCLYLNDLGFLTLQSLKLIVQVLIIEIDSLVTFWMLPISQSTVKSALTELGNGVLEWDCSELLEGVLLAGSCSVSEVDTVVLGRGSILLADSLDLEDFTLGSLELVKLWRDLPNIRTTSIYTSIGILRKLRSLRRLWDRWSLGLAQQLLEPFYHRQGTDGCSSEGLRQLVWAF